MSIPNNFPQANNGVGFTYPADNYLAPTEQRGEFQPTGGGYYGHRCSLPSCNRGGRHGVHGQKRRL